MTEKEARGFLAAFFTYALVRYAFGLQPFAAAVAGLAYAFGGFAVGQVGHLNQISAAAWLAIDVSDPIQDDPAPAPVENGAAVIRAL